MLRLRVKIFISATADMKTKLNRLNLHVKGVSMKGQNQQSVIDQIEGGYGSFQKAYCV